MNIKTVTLTEKQLDFIKSKLVEEILRYEESHPQHLNFLSLIFDALINAKTKVQS